jgi:hypothetical protein
MGNNSIKLIVIAITFLLSMNYVSAFGVSSPYWKNNPLELSPGETKEVAFTLASSPTEETTTAVVSLIGDAGIAEIISGTNYSVAPGSTNTKVILKISLPETATIGYTYNVKFSVKPAPSEGQGTVQLAIKYDIDFPVKVVEKSQVSQAATNESQLTPEKESASTTWIIGIILVLAAVIIGYFLLKKKKR